MSKPQICLFRGHLSDRVSMCLSMCPSIHMMSMHTEVACGSIVLCYIVFAAHVQKRQKARAGKGAGKELRKEANNAYVGLSVQDKEDRNMTASNCSTYRLEHDRDSRLIKAEKTALGTREQ